MKGLNNDQISEVFKKGQVVSSPFFVIKYLLNKDSKDFSEKTSFIVAKKDFKKATQRNYYRRVYREAYRQAKKVLFEGGVEKNKAQPINALNVVVTIKKNKKKTLFVELVEEFLKCLKRIYNI